MGAKSGGLSHERCRISGNYPAATVIKMSNAISAAIWEPAIHKRMVEMGMEPTGFGSPELSQALKRD